MSLDDESPTQNWTRNEADNAPYIAPTFRNRALRNAADHAGLTIQAYGDKVAADHPAEPEPGLWARTPRFYQFIAVYVAGGLTSSAGWFLGSWLLP